MDTIIYETAHFLVTTSDHPHISREDGGHLVIAPKTPVIDRTQLSPPLAIELMRLTMIVGEAMTIALNKCGIDIGRINYQDNGNWGVFTPEGPHLHIHLYGRAKSAKFQPWGEACYFPRPETGFYNGFTPLSTEDIEVIKSEIEEILRREKFQEKNWRL